MDSFLKYLDDLEKDKEIEAKLAGRDYKYIINPEYRWEIWAAPKNSDGKLDYNIALSGDDLKDFVDRKLFHTLKNLRVRLKVQIRLSIRLVRYLVRLKTNTKRLYSS